MNQQEYNDEQSTAHLEPEVSPMDLLGDEAWLRKALEAEEIVGGHIGAGLDWDGEEGKLLLNLELFDRLKTLRISLNREVRLRLGDWNLGTSTHTATSTAREKLRQRLRRPTLQAREQLQAVLHRDDLFGEEFIANRQVLRQLLDVMLTEEDWEMIAAVAADALQQQIMDQVALEKILA